jgi:hypothetical protein
VVSGEWVGEVEKDHFRTPSVLDMQTQHPTELTGVERIASCST